MFEEIARFGTEIAAIDEHGNNISYQESVSYTHLCYWDFSYYWFQLQTWRLICLWEQMGAFSIFMSLLLQWLLQWVASN